MVGEPSEELEASISTLNCIRENDVSKISPDQPVLVEAWVDNKPVVTECDFTACYCVFSKENYSIVFDIRP